MADPIILPSAPIIAFQEYSDPKAGDYLPIVEVASGKTLKIKAQYFGQSAPSTSYKWIPSFDYPVDAIVEHEGKWYKSLQTPNLGKNPNLEPTYWELQTKAAAGFVFWEPGVYTGEPVFVLYEIAPGDIQIFYLQDPTRPYLSEDFEAELIAGDWMPISYGENHFKGAFASIAALEAAVPTGIPGDYALVDAIGLDAILYIWDNTDSLWISATPEVELVNVDGGVADSIYTSIPGMDGGIP